MAIEGYRIVHGENPKPEVATDATPTQVAAFAAKLKHKIEAAIHTLQQEWFLLAEDPKDDIAEHVSKVQSVAHKLKALVETVSDSMIMTKILLTLPPTLNHFCSVWEFTALAERTLNNLKARLSAEEARLKHQEDQSNLSGLITTSKDAKNQALAAKHYKSNDHKELGKKKSSGHGKKSGQCHYGHNQGHWEYDCREKLKYLSNRYEKDAKSSKSHGRALMTHVLSMLPTSESSNEDWYLDSAASSHMSPRKEWFVNLEPLNFPEQIMIGDGKVIIRSARGDINVLAYDGEEWVPKHIQNILYVPDIRFNLFSTEAATDKGLLHVATSTGASFKRNRETVAIREREDVLKN
ncbi:uncharacterized protein LOC107046418 [Diachasma alloeum]|uniref:uncharacterized protein LOC107046418 n=1 Tax=Diachasma alloeum TaxID=454923 RepID=UPI0007381C27|nr:uncharacterized protein LOC107046418 [Diachasma alloeum]